MRQLARVNPLYIYIYIYIYIHIYIYIRGQVRRLGLGSGRRQVLEGDMKKVYLYLDS